MKYIKKLFIVAFLVGAGALPGFYYGHSIGVEQAVLAANYHFLDLCARGSLFQLLVDPQKRFFYCTEVDVEELQEQQSAERYGLGDRSL